MQQHSTYRPGSGAGTSDLLWSVAEQLKVPLCTIARQTELYELTGGDTRDIEAIRTQANIALTLVDSYLLGLELLRSQRGLTLEPVSVSSTLVDTAHELCGYAKQYGVGLEVHIEGKYGPVMANSRGLKAALLSLGYTLIEAQAAQEGKKHWLMLGAHRNAHGVVAGVYGQYEDLHAGQWRRSLELCGRARQPFAELTPGSSAGLFVANTILQAMSVRLCVGRYLKQDGLATTLQPSHQLTFV